MQWNRNWTKRVGWIVAVASLAVFLLAGFGQTQASAQAKYVFLMLGDGMGLPQRNAAEIYMAAQQGKELRPGIVKLEMDTMPAQGMCTTYSTNSIITDSAAAGTAIATGRKTKSGVVCMDPSGKESYKTIAEMAHEQGMKVGIVSTVSIEHATPATFYGHTPDRGTYYDLARQLGKSGFEYFGGGGFRYPRGRDGDRPDAIEFVKEQGYTVTDTTEDFNKLNAKDNPKVLAFNPTIVGGASMPYVIDNVQDTISIADYTKKGVELLDNPRGFFMMVEGGKIDWACHANDAVSAIQNTIAFDEAVKVAMDFYNDHKDETLVIVTGDHECGGLTIGFAGTKYDTFFGVLGQQKSSYEGFNADFAAYRNEHELSGAGFEDILPLIKEHFGLHVAGDSPSSDSEEPALALDEFEYQKLEDAFVRSMKGEEVKAGNEETYLLYGGYEPLTVTITHILDNKAGMAWTSYSHTGVPVPVSALGVNQESFNGFYDNTDIFTKMVQAMEL
ncbi:MAG: alkaline phosphatase [Synergistales bacterium]|nr:alkaline phosphatase [Synergistales bacterium]